MFLFNEISYRFYIGGLKMIFKGEKWFFRFFCPFPLYFLSKSKQNGRRPRDKEVDLKKFRKKISELSTQEVNAILNHPTTATHIIPIRPLFTEHEMIISVRSPANIINWIFPYRELWSHWKAHRTIYDRWTILIDWQLEGNLHKSNHPIHGNVCVHACVYACSGIHINEDENRNENNNLKQQNNKKSPGVIYSRCRDMLLLTLKMRSLPTNQRTNKH